MIKSKKYYLAKIKVQYQPNTFIGGVASSINTPALVASKLGLSVSRIKGFSIIGSDIQFAVTGGSYVIPSNSFSNTSSLTSFIDNDGLVLSVGNSAFFNTPALIIFTSHNIVSVGQSSFRNTGIKSFNFPELITSNCGTAFGSGSFSQNVSLVSFSAPKLVTLTNHYLLYGCTALKTVFVPLLILNIANSYSFSLCSNLENLTIGRPTGLGVQSMSGCSKVTTLDLTDCTELGDSALSSCSLLSNLVNIDNLIKIGSGAFSGTTSLLGNFIANNVTDIGNTAFNGSRISFFQFNSLINLSSPAGFNGTFAANPNLISFYAQILSNVTGNYFFFNCSKLKEFYAPLMVLKINNLGFFYDCSNLENLTIGRPTGLGNAALINCSKVTTLDLTDCTELGDSALSGCSLLNDIYSPNLLKIGSTSANNNVLNNVRTGINITVPIALQTANSGAPDGDLVYAATSRGATIVYV